MSEIDPYLPPPVEPPSPPAETVPREDVLPPRKKSRKGAFFLGIFSGCLVALIVGFVILASVFAARQNQGELSFSSNKIAVVPIEGEIMESRDTIEAIRRYAQSSSVKGIVIRINSPGGAIAPSQEIYSEIRNLRRSSGKPIVASMDSVAASGGYYIAAACDKIVANPGSITGSIGVILQWMDLKELLAWAKMKPETITSGEMKAAGSPFRELTDAERQYLQRIVTQLHGQFVRAVAEGRRGKISEQEVAKLADGRVFTGEEALSLKLVDQLGNLHDAVITTARMAGIKGEPVTIHPRRRESTLIDLLTSGEESRAVLERIISRRTPQFLYKW